MAISGIGAGAAGILIRGAGSVTSSLTKPQAGASTGTGAPVGGAENDFLAYMAKSPMERFQEAWLKQHGISQEQFDAMKPEEKQALLDQMRQEIEQKMKEQAAADPGELVDMMV